MLTSDDFKYIIELENIREMIEYLSMNTHYDYVLDGINLDNLHRSDIEVRLHKRSIYQFEKICHYLSGKHRELIKTFISKYEIQSMKVLIRFLSNNEEEGLSEAGPLLNYSKIYTQVPFEKLLTLDNWDDFKNALKGTDYYRLFQAYDDLSGVKTTFYLEMNLDRYYHDNLRANLLQLDKRENKDTITALRRTIDLRNIIWIYRGKYHYNFSNEELITYSLRGGLQTNDAFINKLANVKELDEFKDVVHDTDYGFLLEHHELTLDLLMQRRMDKYLYNLFLRLFYKPNSGLGKVVAYCYMQMAEIDDLISILESKRYRLSGSEALPYLIRELDEQEGKNSYGN
jgi:V/A-type H+-transporting ATPase subunit C